jgi:hypothetical protein
MNATLTMGYGTRWRWLAAGAALLILSAPGVHAQIYKWTDAGGKVHYSETPPPDGQQFNEVNTGPAPQSSDEAGRQLQDMLKRQQDSEKQEDAEKNKEKEQAAGQAKLDQYCDQARESLTKLENGPPRRLAVVENGEVSRMTEDERQAKIEEIEKTISEKCK